jgi:SsrA-binding protein
LLHKKELNKLASKLKDGGLTCVPTKVFLSHGYAKVEIALAKGKKLHDKRAAIKSRELDRKVHDARNGNME